VEQSREIPIHHHSEEGLSELKRIVAVEEPLEIYVDGEPYAVVMRTPGDEVALAAGLCLSEGLIEGWSDFATIEYSGDTDSNRINVLLSEARRPLVADLIKNRSFIAQTSCGLCGKRMLDDIYFSFPKTTYRYKITRETLARAEKNLSPFQELFRETGCAHAALLCDCDGNVLSGAEDVGRHNALDKAIGKLLQEDKLNSAKLALLSSRGSFEMIQKVGRAGIEIAAFISAPTALAIDLAKEIDITLIGFLRDGNFNIYSGKERIVLS
jgi:FdhD protein